VRYCNWGLLGLASVQRGHSEPCLGTPLLGCWRVDGFCVLGFKCERWWWWVWGAHGQKHAPLPSVLSTSSSLGARGARGKRARGAPAAPRPGTLSNRSIDHQSKQQTIGATSHPNRSISTRRPCVCFWHLQEGGAALLPGIDRGPPPTLSSRAATAPRLAKPKPAQPSSPPPPQRCRHSSSSHRSHDEAARGSHRTRSSSPPCCS
jgi:hypothetical protein